MSGQSLKPGGVIVKNGTEISLALLPTLRGDSSPVRGRSPLFLLWGSTMNLATTTKSKEQLTQEELGYFTGTLQWYRYSPIFPKVLLTDGTLHVAQKGGAFWLMDVIASHIPAIKGDRFALAKLTVTGRTATFVLENGNGKSLAQQEIEYTDFPLAEIKLYVVADESNWIILLPSEY